MNDVEKRSSDLLARVRDFGATHSADFAATTLGGQLFAEVAAVVAELEHHATVQLTNTAPRSSVGRAGARVSAIM